MKFTKQLPLFIATSILLTGCGKKVDCEIPSRHVHRYVCPVTKNITISTYFDSENEVKSGGIFSDVSFLRTDDYIEINKIDEKIYSLFTKYKLFNGFDNWDFLFYEMSNLHDYLEFYYEYDTYETEEVTDSEGNTHTEIRTVHHSGWHTNPYDSDNTGYTRLCHHRYYGYKLTLENNKFVLKKSKSVDDIRDVIDEYPYYCTGGYEIVTNHYSFNRWDLPSLRASDFNYFKQPDLSYNTIRKESLEK